MTRSTVILGASRFGAGLVLDAVARLCPDALVFQDVFQPGSADLDRLSTLTGQDAATIAAQASMNPTELWRSILEAAPRDARDVVVRAFYYHQPRESQLWGELAATARIVHVIRGNLFDAYLSRLNAERSGIWKTNRPVEAGAVEAGLHVDRMRLRRFVRERSEQVRWARRRFSASDYHEVTFEEIAPGPQACLRVARRVMAGSACTATSDLQGIRRRLKRRSNADLVANYADVADLDRVML